jgi:ADP-ribose pyrophosphatase
MNEHIVATGTLFELVQLPQPDGRVFEVARRAPGVRLIIADKKAKQLLLTKEFRHELNTHDYRLPGGKVFDTLAEYETFRKTGRDIMEPAANKAKAEAAEEAGMDVQDVIFYKKSTLGATVEWDLYVFEAVGWKDHEAGQSLEEGEQIDDVAWFSYTEAEQMIIDGKMQEERIALILLQWLKAHA